ncbi:MAG: very short patch repair endonuclease [Bacilli bacterium]|nr:very short patch repair endonuclease [Bacilli bacterium]
MKERSKETISYTMSRIKGKNTGIEIKLRKALYEKGFRYRKNTKYVFGHPDISSQTYKIAIFCDSEFWHGYNFDEAKKKIHSNLDYWIPKIERNIARDKEVNERLEKEGYTVIRFWGGEIDKELDKCVEIILKALKKKGWQPSPIPELIAKKKNP